MLAAVARSTASIGKIDAYPSEEVLVNCNIYSVFEAFKPTVLVVLVDLVVRGMRFVPERACDDLIEKFTTINHPHQKKDLGKICERAKRVE